MVSPSGLEFRNANAADLAAILELVEAAGLPAEGLANFIEDFLVAEGQGRIVACGGIEIYGPAAVLRSFAVQPEFRGGGIGRDIVVRQAEAARAAGVRDLYLFTLDAGRFWRRMGFEQVPLSAWPAAARQGWQYQTVSSRPRAFERMGVISMWRSLDGAGSLALAELGETSDERT